MCDKEEKAPAVRRQITPESRELITEAWLECLAKVKTDGEKKSYEGTRITRLVSEEIRTWMKSENRYLPPELETQIELRTGGVYLPLYLTAQNGLEEFLEAIETNLLNGWPFGETTKKRGWTRKLDMMVRQRVVDECREAGWRNCAEVVALVLWTYLLSHYYFETEEADNEVHDIFNQVMADFDNGKSDDFFAQLEEKVLNHSLLKDPPPRQEDQGELEFGT